MDKQNVTHPYNRILFSNKSEWTVCTCYDLKRCAEGKNSDAKDCRWYDSTYLKYPELQLYIDKKHTKQSVFEMGRGDVLGW